jgi:glyoxylase-like metal-dependent hydrolase (beta-lactamase superfamily II)
MLKRERVAENVYSFQSDVYAQVNAGAVVGPNMAVVIDTLALPEETIEIRQYIEQELQVPIRYVINTHYHADHTWGNYLFPNATILSSVLCRELLGTRGRDSLKKARKQGTTFRQGRIVLPHLTFAEGSLSLRVGKKTLTLIFLPGHSPDNLGVIVEEDRVLFAGDVFMPIPYIVDGNADDMVLSLKQIGKMGLENVVQGHGDIVLRGEIEGSVKDNLAYLSAIRRAVRKAGRRKYPWDLLEDVGVEECGKSRVLLGGLAEELHQRNLYALYEQLNGEPPASSEDEQDLF